MCSKQNRRFKSMCFNMITETNESKKLKKKHISCACECSFDGRKRNSNQKWNNDKCWCESYYLKKQNTSQKYIFAVLLNTVVKMVNILEILFGDSLIK